MKNWSFIVDKRVRWVSKHRVNLWCELSSLKTDRTLHRLEGWRSKFPITLFTSKTRNANAWRSTNVVRSRWLFLASNYWLRNKSWSIKKPGCPSPGRSQIAKSEILSDKETASRADEPVKVVSGHPRLNHSGWRVYNRFQVSRNLIGSRRRGKVFRLTLNINGTTSSPPEFVTWSRDICCSQLRNQ